MPVFDRRAIVNPVSGKQPPQTGPLALMVATEGDLRLLTRLADSPIVDQRRLYTSKLQVHADDRRRFALVGPFIGAPYAVMLLETLVVWQVRRVLFIGWCGAVSNHIKAGDIIVPTQAWIDEGTSCHYGDPSCRLVHASRRLTQRTRLALQHQGTVFHEGAVWTTDGIFRETVEKVKHFQRQGALAVEMELSAILTVAGFRGIEAAGILVVSDELSDYRWRPGFRSPGFKSAREQACRAALRVTRENEPS